jgi:outer membrane protein assembly factor BamB
MRACYVLLPVSLFCGFVACGGDDDTTGTTGAAGGSGGSAGVGGSGGSPDASGGGSAGSGAGNGGSAGSSGRDAGSLGSVLQHHNHDNRDGVYVDAVITKASAATMHIDTTFAMATYTGMMTAQPLYLAGAGSVPDLVIVVTNQNQAIAFNAATGAKVWEQTLGAPVPRSSLAPLKNQQCGNVNPSIGITGTPVIDGATRTLFLDSMQMVNANAAHLVYALDADTGMTRTGWPVDLGTKAKSGNLGFNSLAQNQRGALGLFGGRVLVPFGGHIGDCGDYRGWVVSISTTDPTQVSAFATRAIAGGIWAPSGVSSDGRSVFFVTGNTQSAINTFMRPAMYGDGEAVFKLPPDLTRTHTTSEYFVPTNWQALDDADADLGGTGPLLVDLPGSNPSKLVVQFGKDGKVYIIDRDMMGGESAPLAVATVSPGSPIITAAAAYATPTGTYAVFRTSSTSGCPSGNGPVRAVKITAGSPPSAALAWCAGPASRKSPAVSMSDASGADALIWSIGDDNKLRALDGDTGALVFNGGAAGDTMSVVANFQTPIVANGRIFVAANTQVYAFKP